MKVSQRRSGGCCCGFSTFGGVGEGGVKCSCCGFVAVLDDEQKVAGKRTYFTAGVVCEPRLQKVSIWVAVGLRDRRREGSHANADRHPHSLVAGARQREQRGLQHHAAARD
jgi:hypothetical protein